MSFEQDKQGEFPEARRQSPNIEFEITGGVISLNWGNTLIRYFDEGDGMFDHVVHKRDDGNYAAFKVEGDALQSLLDMGFPRRYDPTADEPTIQWFLQGLEQDIASLDSLE